MEMRNPYEIEISDSYIKSYTKCISCEVQFKDVEMWTYFRHEYAPGGHRIRIEDHVCHNCAKTYDQAIKIFMDKDDYAQYIKVENQIKKLKSKHKGK